MTTRMFRLVPRLLGGSALLLIALTAGAQTPAAKPPERLVSLKLDDSARITNAPSLKVEQMENGGIKISGTNAEELTGDPGFDFTKTFAEPVPASAIRLEINGLERPMLVRVTNEAGKSGHRHMRLDRDDQLELDTIHYNGSPEEDIFSGRLKVLGIFIPIPTASGDFSVEINKIEIVP